MPQFARIPDPLPDWLSAVHDNSYLSAKDLAKLFGVVPNAIHTRVTVCSDFPKPRHFGGRETPAGFKQKDLMGVPWRVAFALQDDGWYLRQDIIWHKPNPMPESIRDRFTKAHEYIFLLAKSRRYYWDQDAIAEPCSEGTHRRLAQDVETQIGSMRAHAGKDRNGRPMKAMRSRIPGNKTHKGTTAYAEGDEFQRTKAGLVEYAARKSAEVTNGEWTRPRKGAPNGSGVKNNPSFDDAMAVMPDMRNPRSVWSITTEPFKEAHFATFPRALPRRCILASTRPGDTVLDPFGGAGTVGLVADELQRDAILIELNPAYADMARKRIAAAAPLLATVAVS